MTSNIFRYDQSMDCAITPAINAIDVKVHGKEITDWPQDLYIPPKALRVFLHAFQGPLDLLLYLIRKQNIDILDIPMATITQQYMQYIDLMHEIEFALASEYLAMAAILTEIKSRMLLPHPQNAEEEADDPRAQLIERLQEYEQFRYAAEHLSQMPQVNRDIFPSKILMPSFSSQLRLPAPNLSALLHALHQAIKRSALHANHQVAHENLSVRERMCIALSLLKKEKFTAFTCLFKLEEGRAGVVVTLLAVLELLHQQMLELVQSEPYTTIHLKIKT